MKQLWEIFRLEIRAIVRSRALALLLVASAGWMFAMPYLVKSDGTEEGARQMYVQYALGGVFAIVVVSLVAAAAGSLAKDRAGKRLQLTQVRPVRFMTMALGRIAAFAATGAFVLAVAAGILAARVELSRPCDHVLSPVMESPQAEAERMYEEYMKDPDTPKEVREAPKDDVVRILRQRASEHYQEIPTNAVESWTFALPAREAEAAVAVRLKFTNMYDVREDVAGMFLLGGMSGVVSNVTKSVTKVPLAGAAESLAAGEGRLLFRNEGKGAVMLRPRRDINLLVGADTFAWNLVRAWAELVSLLTLSVAFAVFLGGSLGRSTAVFTALTMLAIAVLSPAVIEECPYEVDTTHGDRIGLALTHFARAATSPFSAVTPLEHLAADECVERSEVFRTFAVDFVALPLAFAFLAALVIPRKQEGV